MQKQQKKLKVNPKVCVPKGHNSIFTIFAGARNTGELFDWIRTVEELSQDKSYSFNTNIYRQNSPIPNVNRHNRTKSMRLFWPKSPKSFRLPPFN